MQSNVGRPANILLVDDDLDDQQATRRAFSKGKISNNLFVVSDGEEALCFLRNEGEFEDTAKYPRPDLVLLDLNMPRMDGRETLEAIRSDDKLKSLVVVVFTTSSQQEDIFRSYNIGCNSFISKPFDASSFTALIADLEHYWLQVVVLPQ